MSAITVTDLTFYYDGSYETIFEEVSFQVDTGWKLGLVGRNGRGKTTFFKLLLGQLEYGGTISANVKFDYFPYEVQDKTRPTIEVVEEIYPGYEFWELCREWSYLKGDEDVWFRPFETLSNGEQTKVLLAVMFLQQNHFLLIDEPTNHLDMEMRHVVGEYLKRKSGFILVSHDRAFLDECIDHVLAINRNNIEVEAGNFSSWWENKRRRDAFELAEHAKLKKDIKRLAAAARQAENWADAVEDTKIGKKSARYEKNIDTRAYVGEKSRRMQQRRKNLEHRREKELQEKEALLKNLESAENLKIIAAKHHKELFIEAENIAICYNMGQEGGDGTEHTKQVCRGLSFALHSGECLVLEGRNGCGKSSVLKAVLGSPDVLVQGRLAVAAGLKMSYVSQDTSFLSGTLQEYIRQEKIDETLFKQFLRKLDFARSQFDKRMEEFSEGQKKKVLLARSLSEQAHVYIWDEPLNYIDIFSRMQLEELIQTSRPTMILVEHDRSFVERVATQELEFI